MTRSLCVVGAGAAGVGAADALRDADASVTILEKSRGVGGRMATRRRAGCRYDHGANYLKDDDEGRIARLLDVLDDGLVDVDRPVWTFNAAGRISDGDREEDHKWTYESGITGFAKRVLDRADATVRREVRVERLDRSGDDWTAVDARGESRGPFDGVLLTPPAPQTAEILATSDWDNDRRTSLADAADAVPYRTILSYALHYPFEQERPWYGLVDVSRDHEVGWVSREECKRGHVPDGESLLIAQMSPEWSAAHYEDDQDAAAARAAALVADLVGDERLSAPDWTDHQRWRYALPDEGIANATARLAEDEGLFVAGDWVAGAGRAHRAFWNGVAAGERIADRL